MSLGELTPKLSGVQAQSNRLQAIQGACAPLGSFIGGSGISNFNAQNTQYLRAGLARMRAGTGTFKIAIVGDSTTAGRDAVSLNSGYAGARPFCVAQLLANLLSSTIVPGRTDGAQADSWFGNPTVGNNAALVAYDTRLALTGWVAGGSSFSGPGGQALESTTNGALLAFTPASIFDTLDVFWDRQTSGGSFTVNVDGGSTLQTISTAGTTAYMKTTITGITRGTHTINATTTSTSDTQISGMAVRDSTIPRAEVYNLGVDGITCANYNTVFSGHGMAIGIPILAPDVTFINLTINDKNSNPFPAIFGVNMQSIIANPVASGNVILVIGTPISSANQTNGVGAFYDNLIYQLAASNNFPVIDLGQRWVSYAAANAVMPYNDSNSPSLHPGKIGLADVAGAYSLLFH